MKKLILLFTVVLFFITSCSKKNEIISTEQSENEILVPQKFDLDFTKMNFNMASSIMFEMLIEPEKYIDKTVKISGQFSTSIHEGIRHFGVIIWDSTNCCPTGLNFIPPNSMEFPDDFPEKDVFITVSGKMKYIKNENTDGLFFMAYDIYY